MNKTKLIIIVLIVCSITAFLTVFLTVSYERPYVSYDMYLTVGDYVGVNTDTDALWFGTVMPGEMGNRWININSTEQSKVVLEVSGELASWVSVSDNNFIVESGENKSIKVTALVLETAKYGDYAGKLNIYFRKV